MLWLSALLQPSSRPAPLWHGVDDDDEQTYPDSDAISWDVVVETDSRRRLYSHSSAGLAGLSSSMSKSKQASASVEAFVGALFGRTANV